MVWPFLLALGFFAYFIIKARTPGQRPLSLDTLRKYMVQYAALCREIAAERLRMATLQGSEREASLQRIEALEQKRVRAEASAVRLREELLHAGFGVGDIQLTTVADAEAELAAERARGTS